MNDNQKTFWQSLKLREKLTLVIGVIYLLSPIDLVPEAVLGPLGLLDDGGALIAIIATYISARKRYDSQKELPVPPRDPR